MRDEEEKDMTILYADDQIIDIVMDEDDYQEIEKEPNCRNCGAKLVRGKGNCEYCGSERRRKGT